MKIIIKIIFLAFFFQISSGFSIEDFGAKPNDVSNAAGYANAAAIVAAAIAANNSETDREVLIPFGKLYNVFNIELKDLQNVKLRIDGILMTSNNITEWYSIFPLPPHVEDAGHPACLHVVVSFIKISFRILLQIRNSAYPADLGSTTNGLGRLRFDGYVNKLYSYTVHVVCQSFQLRVDIMSAFSRESQMSVTSIRTKPASKLMRMFTTDKFWSWSRLDTDMSVKLDTDIMSTRSRQDSPLTRASFI